jgi:carbohydrate-selective porin OprB
MTKTLHKLGALLVIASSLTTAAIAGDGTIGGMTNQPSSGSFSLPAFSWKSPTLDSWWNGNSGTAGWFGLGKSMGDYGLTISGTAREVFLGQVGGGLKNVQQGNWVNEEKIAFIYDFSKLFGINGLIIESDWRYRNVDGSQNTPTTGWAAGTLGNSSMFNPSKDTSGMGVRILPQFLKWQSEKGDDPNFMVKGGWVNPYEDFLQQPDSKWFQNNAIASAKGIGGSAGPGTVVGYTSAGAPVYAKTTAVPWSSSYASWGGMLRAKPSSETYVQAYLGLAIGGYSGVQSSPYTYTDVYPYSSVSPQYLGSQKQPVAVLNTVGVNGQLNGKTTTKNNQYVYNNHGFNFQGAAPYNNPSPGAAYPNGAYYNNNVYSQNGIYNVEEVGWTPKWGQDKLAGKYVLGGYIWGQNNTSYTPTTWIKGQTKPYPLQNNSLVWGLYLQADQRLTAVHNQVAAPSLSDKNPVDEKNPAGTTTVADKVRGLYMINECTFTPPQNCAIPFYFQTGLVYKGLFDARKQDTCGIVLGMGFYSQYLNEYTASQNQALANGYGSKYNVAVPNGPVAYNSPNATTGKTSSATAYEYQPGFTSTEVVEAFYNVQINKWLAFRPDAQFIANPAGNGTCGSDWILGAEVQAKF